MVERDAEKRDLEQDDREELQHEGESGEWEDIDTIVEMHSSSLSSSSRTSGSPRKRRTGSGKLSFIAGSPSSRKYHQASPRPRASRQSSTLSNPRSSPADVTIGKTIDIPPLFDGGDVQLAVHTGIRSTIYYVFDVITTILYWVKKPLSWIAALFVVLYLMQLLGRPFFSFLHPICTFPFISRSTFCTSMFPPPYHAAAPVSGHTESPNKIHRADYPQIMKLETQTFEKLLDDTIGGSALALEIRKAELATTDLITLVKFSDLTSKENLANALDSFVNEAKATSRNLQKLDTKVIGALDSISQMNEYALKLIESSTTKSTPNPLSPIRILNLLGVTSTSKSQNLAVLETFEQTMTMLSQTLQRLILQAEVAQQSLEILEERLQTLHEMVAREDHGLTEVRQDVLDLVWTKLGFNRRELRKFEAHFALLRHVGAYRTQALAHVVAALHALREMSDGMEDLRDRVAAPELIGTEIPLEVHIQSIKAGLNRLKRGSLKASQKRIAIQDALTGDKENEKITIDS